MKDIGNCNRATASPTAPKEAASTPQGPARRKPFEPPRLSKHEPLQNITLVSTTGSGVTGASFF